MKIYKILPIVFLSIFSKITAQNTFPATGNVGIGTSSPTSPLDVNGIIKTSGGVEVKGLDASKNYIRFSHGSTAIGMSGSAYNYTGNAADNNDFGHYVYGNNNYRLYTNGSERLRVTGSGNIGVGMSNPTEKLQVAGNILGTSNIIAQDVSNNGSAKLTTGNSTNSGLVSFYLPNGTRAGYFGFANASGIIYSAENAPNHLFFGGNLGINTWSPTDKLDVAGAIRLTTNTAFDAGKAGRIYKNDVHGLALQGIAGTSNNIALAAPNGNLLFTNPINTDNVILNPNVGNVGIGTLSPSSRLHIFSPVGFVQKLESSNTFTALAFYNTSNNINNRNWAIGTNLYNYGDFNIVSSGVSSGEPDVTNLTRLTINNIGNIGIGTVSPRTKLDINGNVAIGMPTNKAYPDTYKLAIGGNALAEKMVVKLQTNWPDYVFHSDYTLPPLSQVEEHIKTKGHLPNIPTEKEVKETGIDLGDMNAKLLQKIEELTLYLIENERKVQLLQEENKKEIQLLKEEIKKLKSK